MNSNELYKYFTVGFSLKIPEYPPSFEEISKQLRINGDIIKQEITDHVDKEIKRLKDMCNQDED